MVGLGTFGTRALLALACLGAASGRAVLAPRQAPPSPNQAALDLISGLYSLGSIAEDLAFDLTDPRTPAGRARAEAVAERLFNAIPIDAASTARPLPTGPAGADEQWAMLAAEGTYAVPFSAFLEALTVYEPAFTPTGRKRVATFLETLGPNSVIFKKRIEILAPITKTAILRVLQRQLDKIPAILAAYKK